MSNPDFLSMVAADENMAVEDVGEEGVIRVWARNGQLRRFDVDAADIQNHDWDELCAVFFCKRPVKIMKKYQRVVGYYSDMANWNRSKLAEARDRAKGNYEVN